MCDRNYQKMNILYHGLEILFKNLNLMLRFLIKN